MMRTPLLHLAVLLVLPLAFARPAVAQQADPRSPAAPADSGRTVVLTLTSTVFGNTRALRVHLPPGYDDPANARRRYPALYMNDGFAVFAARHWGAPRIVDSLVSAGAIAPFILVGIDNAASIAGSATPGLDRTREYLPYPDPLEPDVPEPRGTRYPEFVTREVMPLVEREFRVDTSRAHTAVGGASYGGIAALTTFIAHPRRFGHLLLESTPTFLFGGRLVREAAAASPPPRSLYVGIGTRETADSTVLRAAATLAVPLEDAVRAASPATRVLLNRVEGAQHVASAWRARLPVALRFLFPPAR